MEPPQGTSAFRIAFVTYEYPPQVYGGAGTYAAAMCGALASLGAEVHVVTPAEPDCPDPPESFAMWCLGLAHTFFASPCSGGG
jgi:hypothetical protein